ncbi:hypothetical protein CVT24_004893 [Panaeolus cyanescens]|uniref:F-box domain-containing protein n=1 Tax=Panaeolus cyanescens TaxID=181874 RepID=A0A409W203_9AGAR|nr:hypothetical protein CVT24_004893 [Panaeolus cyanescens]
MQIHCLPFDILASICGYLDALDVFALGSVNKDLYNVINTHTIWKKQLRIVIHENGLYAPSFPMHKMSVRELIQTACGPGRMVERFWANHEKLSEEERQQKGYTHPTLSCHADVAGSSYNLPCLSRRAMRILELPEGLLQNNDDNQPFTYNKLCLIPGGRFLACIVGKEAFIWDLGLPANREHVSPVIYCRWPITGDEIFMPGPSANGKELRLIMGTMSSPESVDPAIGILTVYRIWEEEDETGSSHVVVKSHTGPLHQPQQITFFTIFGDLCVYMHRKGDLWTWFSCHVVYVWDFMNNTYASWAVENTYSEVFIDNGFLCMIELPNVMGWKIPPLKPADNWLVNEVVALPVDPSFSISLRSRTAAGREGGPPRGFSSLIGRLLDWYNISKPLRQFDGIGLNDEDQYELWTYSICDWPSQWALRSWCDNQGFQRNYYIPHDAAPDPPPYIQLQHTAAYLGNGPSVDQDSNDFTLDPYRICGGYTVKNMLSSDNKVWLMVELPEFSSSEGVSSANDTGDDVYNSQRPKRVITLQLDVPRPKFKYRPTMVLRPDPIGDAGFTQYVSTGVDPVEDLAAAVDDLSLENVEIRMPQGDDLHGRTDFSFDPCSGRFCFIADGRERIGIVEFLKWS